MSPQSWSRSSLADLAGIRGVCFDIDDTLTTHGRLELASYQALWRLKQAGFALIPVTGRPAGWCDLIVRLWPVSAVIAENGALALFQQEQKQKEHLTLAALKGAAALEQAQAQLAKLKRELVERFPQLQWASDQPYRRYDCAVDVGEEVERWEKNDVSSLVRYCTEKGAHAKVSNIHCNIWFGNYNKWVGFHSWLSAMSPIFLQAGSIPTQLSEWIYVGDSLNDEPMFESFQYSVGVANVRPLLEQMRHQPRWITSAPSGQGFCQVASKLLRSQFCQRDAVQEVV